ncbi:MAG: hypothetical protein ABSF64_24085 [Bryobacteraceae bacterium]|jgi:hypothetical protein
MNAGAAELEVLAGRLRARVAEGRYAEAQAVLRDYCGALRKTAAGLPRGDARLARLEHDWERLAEETRRRLLAGRAHAGARLARLARMAKRSQFYGDRPPARRTWEWLA